MFIWTLAARYAKNLTFFFSASFKTTLDDGRVKTIRKRILAANPYRDGPTRYTHQRYFACDTRFVLIKLLNACLDMRKEVGPPCDLQHIGRFWIGGVFLRITWKQLSIRKDPVTWDRKTDHNKLLSISGKSSDLIWLGPHVFYSTF